MIIGALLCSPDDAAFPTIVCLSEYVPTTLRGLLFRISKPQYSASILWKTDPTGSFATDMRDLR